MQKERLINLFETFDPAVRNIILSVLDIEQEHISKLKPHVIEPIKEIVTAAAKKEVKKLSAEEMS